MNLWGQKPLFWLSDWKATVFAAHTHFKHSERSHVGVHLLAVYHKMVVNQTKGPQFEAQTGGRKSAMAGNYTTRGVQTTQVFLSSF